MKGIVAPCEVLFQADIWSKEMVFHTAKRLTWHPEWGYLLPAQPRGF